MRELANSVCIESGFIEFAQLFHPIRAIFETPGSTEPGLANQMN